jgi:hypothetical protein
MGKSGENHQASQDSRSRQEKDRRRVASILRGAKSGFEMSTISDVSGFLKSGLNDFGRPK